MLELFESPCHGLPMRWRHTADDEGLGVRIQECPACRRRYEVYDAEEGRPATRPTDAPAGSEAKVRVMAGRAARREALFHPADSTASAPQRPRVGGGVGDGSLNRRLPKGVSRCRRKWRARIRSADGEGELHLGVFDTIAEAEAAVRAELARRAAAGGENGKAAP